MSPVALVSYSGAMTGCDTAPIEKPMPCSGNASPQLSKYVWLGKTTLANADVSSMKLDKLTMNGIRANAALNSEASGMVKTGFASLRISTSMSPLRALAASCAKVR